MITQKNETAKISVALFWMSLLICLHTNCIAQDSTLIHSIEKETRHIYDETDKQYWFLTKERVITFADTIGTEIAAYLFKDTINRIVCIGYDPELEDSQLK
jgi:hypothetical protein